MRRGSLWAFAMIGGGCLNPPVAPPAVIVTQETRAHVDQNVKNHVDLLFMVDNSPSMTPKQEALKSKFPELIKVLDEFNASGHPAWYHIGVVTSDLGAGPKPLGSNCKVVGGDGGRLQAKGVAAALSCGDLGADTSTAKPARYIDYDQIHSKNNLPAGQDLPQTFGCMASVGNDGCGMEHQLESAYKALRRDPIVENTGFLRSEALLVVVFVTDEDDCSAPPTTDLFDPFKINEYGASDSYRCTHYGLTCGDPAAPPPYGSSMGPLAMCVAAPNLNEAGPGKLFDVSRYINYFTKARLQGGIKDNPDDVILASIAAPGPSLGAVVQTILTSNPQTTAGTPYVECAGPISKNCAVALQHSCTAASDTKFSGDPAVRLSQVVRAAKEHQETSICNTDYAPALQNLGQLIVDKIGTGCLGAAIDDRKKPDCVVEDVTPLSDGTNQLKSLSRCADCSTMPYSVTPTCWCLVDNPSCPAIVSPRDKMEEHFSVRVCRDETCSDTPTPAGTFTDIACATIAATK